MSDLPLDPSELAAIQDAIRESRGGPERPVAAEQADLVEAAVPLAIIADDRAAEVARPSGMRLAERWAMNAKRAMRHYLPGDSEISVVNADIVDGTGLRDELGLMWCCTVAPKDRPGPALIAIGGSLIEASAAWLLGDSELYGLQDRAPTAAALGVFRPVGESFAEALVTAWRHLEGCPVIRDSSFKRVEATKKTLTESEVVIAVTLSVSGTLTGRIRLLARPVTLVAPPTPVEAVPAPPGAIEEALGEVPVEVDVEFGRAKLSMRELFELRVGDVLTLSQFVDEPLPVRCAGVIKARGRAMVCRGVLAVRVEEEIAEEKGMKAA